MTNKDPKPFQCEGLRITFQNVRTINSVKLAHLVGHLTNTDIIFLSEVNSPISTNNFCFANDNKFNFHFDPNVRRIAAISSKLCDVKSVGIGIKLDQLRTQADKTAVQSFVYEIIVGKEKIFIENFYVVPNLSPNNIRKLTEHIDDQAKKYKRYIAGGDFNLNWLESKVRDHFAECSSVKQRITDLTRVCEYVKDGSKRTSKSLIDLIFCNIMVNSICHSPKVKVISKQFDHKSVSINIAKKSYNYYRDVKYFKNPFNRPVPKPAQEKILNEKIERIPDSQLTSYDALIHETRKVLDEVIPLNSDKPMTKRIYKTPFSRQLIKEIKYKHYLEKKMHKTIADRQKYIDQRNKVTDLRRKEQQSYRNNLIEKSKNPGEIHKVMKFLESGQISTINGNPDIVSVNGICGKELAEQSAEFFRKRAEDLVPESQMISAGPPGPALRPNEELSTSFDFLFPFFYENFCKYIPKNKITNSAGPDTVSAAVLEKIWQPFSLKLNKVIALGGNGYPLVDNGYYQRSIPKIVGIIELLKQLRPLGVLNPVPKYHFNRPFFKELRNHLEPIFSNRNNYTYKGTHQCIINTFDNVIDRISRNEKVVMVKYDFSNAFGTIHHAAVMEIFRQLNISENSLNYIEGYLENQQIAQTVISDKTGFHFSKPIKMSRGCPQGQVGSDLIFLVQQFIFQELSEVYRSSYMDDLNDICSRDTDCNTIKLVKDNEAALVVQSSQAGFALNEDKTTYIPHNVSDSSLTDAGLKVTRNGEKCEVLGFPYEATHKGFDVTPAINMILKRLNARAPNVHASREYFESAKTRSDIARAMIYHSIGELHLVLAYDNSNKGFNKIRVKVNDILRATGLRNTTPTSKLDQIFGTNLLKFAQYGILINGLKMVMNDPLFFDRGYSTRKRFTAGTYMAKFVELWIDLPLRLRKKLLSIDKDSREVRVNPIKSVKSILKKDRQLKYDTKIHTEYKWISYKD